MYFGQRIFHAIEILTALTEVDTNKVDVDNQQLFEKTIPLRRTADMHLVRHMSGIASEVSNHEFVHLEIEFTDSQVRLRSSNEGDLLIGLRAMKVETATETQMNTHQLAVFKPIVADLPKSKNYSS